MNRLNEPWGFLECDLRYEELKFKKRKTISYFAGLRRKGGVKIAIRYSQCRKILQLGLGEADPHPV